MSEGHTQRSAEERHILAAGMISYRAGRKASNLKKWINTWDGGNYRGDGDGIDAANDDHRQKLHRKGWAPWQVKYLMSLFQDGWSHQATGDSLDFAQPLDHQRFDERASTYLEELRQLAE